MPIQSETHIDIWNFYLDEFHKKLEKYTPKIYPNTEYTAVIVETRNHKHLEVVIKNTMYFLNESTSDIKWGLKIYHSFENSEFVKSITNNWNNVITFELKKNIISIDDYNELFKSTDFWQNLPSNNILIFQTDSILLKFGIDDFINYGYVGAPWHREREGTFIGNGGLSFRNKNMMIDVIKKYDINSIKQEDIYFSKYLNKEYIAPLKIAKRFSVEDVPYDNPLGLHQPKIEPTLLEKILKKSLNKIKLK